MFLAAPLEYAPNFFCPLDRIFRKALLFSSDTRIPSCARELLTERKKIKSLRHLMTLLALRCSAKINVASPLSINLKPWQTMPGAGRKERGKEREKKGDYEPATKKGNAKLKGKTSVGSFTFIGNFSEILKKKVELDRNKHKLSRRLTKKNKNSESEHPARESVS